MHRFIRGLGSILVGLFIFSGSAQAAEDEMKYLLQFGWDLGGDEVARAQYVNGPQARIKANEGFLFDWGVSIPTMNASGSLLETQVMVGIKYVTVIGTNGKMSFTSLPLTAVEQFVWQNGITLGAGVTYQLYPKLSGTGVLAVADVKMDNALGFIGQVGYTTKMATFGVRYTKIEYQPKLYTGKVKGDGFGFYVLIKY